MTTSTDEIGLILDHEGISPQFQPIVDLFTGAVVAFEGLCRGPEGSPLHMPDDLFDAARAADRLEDLDWHCRTTVLRAALDVGLRPPLTVFLNVEPRVLSAAPIDAMPVLARAIGGLRVIIELTERALLERPATLLRFVEKVRQAGWGIALDDVGAHPHSLAMLSVIEPDVVKLDLQLLLGMPGTSATSLLSGVQTYCRRSGARLVAEGVETEDDVGVARSIGAHYGQGWTFGGPTSLAAAPTANSHPVPMINPRPHRPTRRLINLLSRADTPVPANRTRIDRASRYMLEHAAEMGPSTLVLACVQGTGFVSTSIRDALEKLAQRVAYVAVLGTGLSSSPLPGVHGVEINAIDPLVSEWVIATIGLHESMGLVASDLGDDYDDGSARRYEYAVTYDPQMVTDVARALMTRIV